MTITEFFQTSPQLQNQYRSDPWLRNLLRWRLPQAHFERVAPDLDRFGARVVDEMLALAAEAERIPPRHIPFDPWGRRIDRVEVSHAWQKLAAIAAEEGIVALGYERPCGAYSRLYQLAKLYLYHPSSAIFSCPLAMTDGAARILELLAPPDLKERALTNLTSRNPQMFWTSGQWMTEKTGGSDVSLTSTVARPVSGGFELYGIKWFTSSVTSQMALALARIDGATAGSKGLSLFYAETYRDDGSLNRIQVLRLKDKLGTRALPTAEIELKGTSAQLLGEEGRGVKNIATMLNITRLYNAICSVAHMRRGLVLWRDYATRRAVFGKTMLEHPLFIETYAEHSSRFVASFLLTFAVSELLGKDELGAATEDEHRLLRLLTPIAKLYTGKQAVWTTSEVVEGFGGAGYVEDTGMPAMLRDAQVFPIWEGPTNVLALDLLRVLNKGEVLPAFFRTCRAMIHGEVAPDLAAQVKSAEAAIVRLEQFFAQMGAANPEIWQAVARDMAFAMAEVFSGCKMLAWSGWAKRHGDVEFQAMLAAACRQWWRVVRTDVRLPMADQLAVSSALLREGESPASWR